MTYPQTTSSSQLIAASKLEKSPLNARKTVSKGGIEELKASILSHGLMQNLVVTEPDDGVYHVIAGGRRLQAIHSLQEEGKLPQDYTVPCQVVTEESAPEMSLAENVVRLAMHPADQFEAFAELIGKGHTAAEVAVRFGIEESLVHKRMKLAHIAPELFQKYRDDELTLECLMAFAVVDDHERQLNVYHTLHSWQQDDPSAIRDALTEAMIEASSKLARFVGLNAYRDAGGSTHTDLFGEDIYIEQPELLQALAQQKLGALRQQLEAEGWGWIEVNPERDYSFINRCTRIRPQLVEVPADLLDLKAQLDAELEAIEQMLEETESDETLEHQHEVQDRLDEVESKLADYVGFDADQKPLAGCFVSIDQDGTPFIDKGLVKPEHRKHPLARDDVTAVLGKKLDALPFSVREPTRVPIGTYLGLAFGVIVHPHFPPDVYLEGELTRTSGLSKEHQGPRAVLNALERIANGYAGESVRVRQDLSIAESQLRDYQDRLGKPFQNEAYLSELTSLRDQLKGKLSASGQASDDGPTASELAEQIKGLRAANSVDAMPQRSERKASTAEEPITARIRRRQEESAVSGEVPNSPAAIPGSFSERILRERDQQNDGHSPA